MAGLLELVGVIRERGGSARYGCRLPQQPLNPWTPSTLGGRRRRSAVNVAGWAGWLLDGWDWLIGLGVLLELAGLGVTLCGLASTWRQFEPRGEPYLEPVLRPARQFAHRARSLRRRLIRWWRKPVVATGTGHATIRVSGAGTSSAVGRPTVKTYAQGLEGQVEELRDRVTAQEDAQRSIVERLAQEELARAAAVSRLEDEQASDRRRLDERTREIALDGLRVAGAGVAMIATGAVCQGAASLLSGP